MLHYCTTCWRRLRFHPAHDECFECGWNRYDAAGRYAPPHPESWRFYGWWDHVKKEFYQEPRSRPWLETA